MVEARQRDRGWWFDAVTKRLAPALLLVLVPLVAQAQSTRAPVATSGCPAELASAMEPALDVELSNASADARSAIAEGALRPEIACSPDTVVVAVVRTDGERVEQRVAIEGPALARRLAMVVTELLEASSAPEEAESVSADATDEPIAPVPVAPADPLRVRLRLGVGAWIGGEPAIPLGALEIGVAIAPVRNVEIVAAAAGALGGTSVPNAHLDVRLLSAALSLRFGADVDVFWLGAGPAARGGAVLWTGTPADPARGRGGDLVGGWLAVGAVLVGLARVPSTPVRVGVELEGGGIAFSSGALVLGVLAQQIGGGWLEARAVFDLAFD